MMRLFKEERQKRRVFTVLGFSHCSSNATNNLTSKKQKVSSLCCNIPMIRICEIDIGNPKYTRSTLRLLSSGTKLLFTFLSLKIFRHVEREAQYFYADCFYIVSSQPNQRAAPVAHKGVWSHPALNFNSLVRRQELN